MISSSIFSYILFILKNNFYYFYVQKTRQHTLSLVGGHFFSLCLFHLGNVSHQRWAQGVASLVKVDLIISVTVIGTKTFHQFS